MSMIDVTLLTQREYYEPTYPDSYVNNILKEDALLSDELRKLGLKVNRNYWDNPVLDLSKTRCIVFRAVWDYFHRFDEFETWLKRAKNETQLINSYDIITWNLHKSYLADLKNKGINIPPTVYIDQKSDQTLTQHCQATDWNEFVLKPAIAGGGRHTHRFVVDDCNMHQTLFAKLNEKETWLLQEYQPSITKKGEVTHVMFGGVYSHSILKKAKAGDFRVQDDFGGTVHSYVASWEEVRFSERAIRSVEPTPVYGRVDVIWNKQDQPCLAELELIEPELWLRENKNSAKMMAEAIMQCLCR